MTMLFSCRCLSSTSRALLSSNKWGKANFASPYKDVVTYENVVFPPEGPCKLPAMPTEPTYDESIGEKEYKGSRRMIEQRGVELVHTELIHRQYGLAAKTGGFLGPGAFKWITEAINQHLQDNQFAVWRVDPPWLPRWAKPKGQKKGGGKGPIALYVTPVKTNRIILELGGHITELEARGYLMHICDFHRGLPMEFVSQQLLDERRKLEPELEHRNLNKFTWDTVVKYNMQDVHSSIPPYDLLWKGQYK